MVCRRRIDEHLWKCEIYASEHASMKAFFVNKIYI